MPEGPQRPEMERRIVSVLFADLVGFTALSERLDPEDVATVQDAYFAAVRETVERHGGMLEKFIGDAAMAVFGVPRARDDDAERAVRTGLALIGAIELLGPRVGLDDSEGLRLRVGVNTGEVVSAETGPDAGRVTGDTVNLAARFQAAAEPGTILVGELTQLSAGDAIEFASMGALNLKGKAEPVPAWRVSALRPEPSREEALGALRAPLLGREHDMAALEAALTASRGGPRVLVLVAPPGVGKSRLLLEFASRAESSGSLVLRTRVRADMLGPGEPVSQLLTAALRARGATTRETLPAALEGALATAGIAASRRAVVTDEVHDTLWPPPVAPAEPPDRDARFGAWLEALDALSGEQPTAWLVEDIHWAGPDLLAFLDRAGREPSRNGRLVVATARPSVLERLPQDTETLDLPPLPVTSAAELVQALIGDALPSDVVATIADRSDGNPLFIEELLRSWISSGTLIAAPEGGWTLAVPPEAVPLPATVQAIYAAQLDDLPSAARLLARRASVAGRRFAVRTLEPLEVPEPAEGLDSLRQRAFLRGPEVDLGGDEVYAYRHALLRDAGYASLSRAERQRLHTALAIWLEQTAGTDPARVAEPIASHYHSALSALPAVGCDPGERARLTEAARTWLERAADAALGVAAHQAAIELLARAIGLADDEREAARLRLRRGELLTNAGDMDAGMTEIRTARDVFRQTFDSDRSDEAARSGYGNATALLAEAMVEQIRFIEARDLVADTLAEVQPPEDALVGRLLALHAWAMVMQGDREGTIEEVDRALDLVRGGDPRLEVEVRARRAGARTEALYDVAEEWRELEDLAASIGSWHVAMRARNMRLLNADDSQPRAVLAEMRQSIELATSHGMTEQACWSRYSVVQLLFSLGDWDEAVTLGIETVDIAERNAYLRPTFRTWMALLPVLTARADLEPLARYAAWLEANRTAFPEPPSPYGLLHSAATDRMYSRAGLEGPAHRTVGPDELVPESYGNPDYLVATEAVVWGWLADREPEEKLRAALDRIRTAWLEPGGTPPGAIVHASLDLMGAWLARSAAPDETAEHARRCADRARAGAAPWWVARAIRALPKGAATAAELHEAEAIERRLGVTPRASDPPV